MFGYLPVAEQLLPNITRPPGSPSLIVGIEAPWGAGKTSFLNILRDLLSIDPGHVVLDYLPWLYSTVDSLLIGFCNQLSSQLNRRSGKKLQAIGAAFGQLSSAISPFAPLAGHPVLGLAATTITGLIAKGLSAIGQRRTLDVSNAQQQVQKAILDSGKSIVVFLDDIDRLPPIEIRLLFQFLKAVAAFDGVVYVLAYDPSPVEKALSFDQTLDGREVHQEIYSATIEVAPT